MTEVIELISVFTPLARLRLAARRCKKIWQLGNIHLIQDDL
jgi:hypothetical protein